MSVFQLTPDSVRTLKGKLSRLFVFGGNPQAISDQERMEESIRLMEQAEATLIQYHELGPLIAELKAACESLERQRRAFAEKKGIPVPE